MPVLTGPIRRGDALVQVRLEVPGGRARVLLAKGQQPPPAVSAPGILDSAASLTVIDAGLRQALNVPRSGWTTLLTPHSGPNPPRSPVYRVRLTIVHPSGDPHENLVLDPVRVVETDLAYIDTKVLIGWNVLATCRFLYDGPAQRFSLGY